LEGCLAAKTVRSITKQVIELPLAIKKNALDAEDQKIIRAKEVKTIAKRRLKLEDTLKIGYATIYDQCSQEVQDKLEATDNWDKSQQKQSLHKLIQRAKCICVGFDDHKPTINGRCSTWCRL
jgi:hypothetical protein